MIVDRIERLHLYKDQIPGAEQIQKAFACADPALAPCKVLEKSYAPKTDAQRRFEVHFRTIDLMMAREGAEVIHMRPCEELTPAELLASGADGRKLDGEIGHFGVPLKAGCFCAIFPGEAHMVGGACEGAPEGISKWVVKVPAPEAFCVEDRA